MRFKPTVIAGFVMITAAAHAAQQTDVIQALGTTQAVAQNVIVASFSTGMVMLAGERTVFRSASPDLRAAMVKGVVAIARAYTATEDFARRYAQFREGRRPERDVLPHNGDEALAAQQKQLEEVIRQAQKMAAELPVEARQQLADNIADMKKQLAELNSDPKHRAAVDAAAKESAREAEAEYARRDRAFEREFPARAQQLIAERLKAFLELSATVDFNATLVEKDKRMRFADPDLEAKPREWKMLYRAGKPAVDTARAAAEEWLHALGM
jgi:hypothetical protein